MKILIAGGGIGGLTAALSCLNFGHEVIVFETTDKLGEVGAGIQLPPNAMKVFDALGLVEDLKAVSFRPDAIEARLGKSGHRVFRIPFLNRDKQTPYLHIHRADYISVLYKAVKRQSLADIRLGSRITQYETEGQGVSITLKSGVRVSGDVLIGADGIHSAIRTQMHGTDSARFTGHVAWRCAVPTASLKTPPPPTACAWFGKGQHAVTYRIRNGDLVNFVGVVEHETWREESWQSKGRKLDLISDFSTWHPILQDILHVCEPDALFKWALYDRPPLKTWSKGHVTLLGDAAHPMLPFLAQGAAMAVEDAWCLACWLSHQPVSIEMALKYYEDQRLTRTAHVQRASTRNGQIFHKKNVTGQMLTYGPMWLAGKGAPSLIRARLQWLYDYDIVAQMAAKFPV